MVSTLFISKFFTRKEIMKVVFHLTLERTSAFCELTPTVGAATVEDNMEDNIDDAWRVNVFLWRAARKGQAGH